MTSVPRTVPSKPLRVRTSRRQIISAEAAMKRARNSQGAHGPVLSIQVTRCFKPGNLRSRGALLPRGEGLANGSLQPFSERQQSSGDDAESSGNRLRTDP